MRDELDLSLIQNYITLLFYIGTMIPLWWLGSLVYLHVLFTLTLACRLLVISIQFEFSFGFFLSYACLPQFRFKPFYFSMHMLVGHYDCYAHMHCFLFYAHWLVLRVLRTHQLVVVARSQQRNHHPTRMASSGEQLDHNPVSSLWTSVQPLVLEPQFCLPL